jgi:hypothetical protein
MALVMRSCCDRPTAPAVLTRCFIAPYVPYTAPACHGWRKLGALEHCAVESKRPAPIEPPSAAPTPNPIMTRCAQSFAVMNATLSSNDAGS